MTANSRLRRRIFGTLCLLAAISMLGAEEFFLKDRLRGLLGLGYWLVCLVLTLCAIGAAFMDLRELRRQTRDEHRALFESTLQKIREENSRKGNGVGHKPGEDS